MARRDDGESRPVRPVQQSRAHITRRALLAAAGEHFATHGYHATTLADLLRDGTATKGALYFHFPSKEALAGELVSAMSESWERVLPEVLRQASDALEALVLLTDVVIVRMDDPVVRGAARVLRDGIVRTPSLVEVSAAWQTENRALLLAAGEAGLLRDHVNADWTAEEIVVSLAGRATFLESLGAPGALWEQMNGFWAGMLPLIAGDGWLSRWNARPWQQRSRPTGVAPRDSGPVTVSGLGAATELLGNPAGRY
jgi:AcrR family transcriptional regulator